MAPATLRSALDGLFEAGAITGYVIDGDEVAIQGDLVALEALVRAQEAQDGTAAEELGPSAAAHDARAEYFRACQRFRHTSKFRELPKIEQVIWRLHANGATNNEIRAVVQRTAGVVRGAIRRGRIAAGLPATVSTIGHGTRKAPAPCVDIGCARPARAAGRCNPHYQRARRRNLSRAA